MKFALIIEKFDSESNGTIDLDRKSFCSKECTNDFLFEEFGLEGLLIKNEEVINLSDCTITVVESEEDYACEYGC
jgi:hypothetical protein